MLGGEPVKMELSQDAEEAASLGNATWALTGRQKSGPCGPSDWLIFSLQTDYYM